MIHFKRLMEESASEWNSDNAPRLSAALAFYTLLSLSPIIIILLGVAGLAFGRGAVEGQLAWQIHSVVGWEGARAIQALIGSAHHPHVGILATAVSIVTLALGASSVLVELRSGLNTVWHVPPGPSVSNLRMVLQMVKERFYSFILVATAGLVLLLSVAASAGIADLNKFFGPGLTLPQGGLRLANFLTSYVLIALLFAAIYRVIPDVRLRWSDVIIGAAVTALVFTIGKQLIALYLAKATFVSAYGAAGSFVVLLVWVYYSAQLFFLGAEFTKIYARRYGSHSAGGEPGRAPTEPAPTQVETRPRRRVSN